MEVGGADPLAQWKIQYNFTVDPTYYVFLHLQVQPAAARVVPQYVFVEKSPCVSGLPTV